MLAGTDYADRLDLERTIYRFFLYLDERRYDDLCALMAPNGVWYRQGKALRGPVEVLEALKLRPAGATTRHLITNVIVDMIDDTHAQATHYLAVFFHGAEKPPSLPVPIELPRHISIFREEFTRTTSDGWRVAAMSEIPTFAKT
jgi:SnoaL-like domain